MLFSSMYLDQPKHWVNSQLHTHLYCPLFPTVGGFISLYSSTFLPQDHLFYICRNQYIFLAVNMFRRLSSSLPKDPEFPADLEALG